MDIVGKVKQIIMNMNEKGIPVPLIRDPAKDGPSISLTFLIISGLCVFVGLIGKWSKALGEVDISGALYWFGICSGLYFGRKITSDSTKKTVELGEKEDK